MIERIIIKNFKGIKEADISFHDKINVIVGNNGVGKSTLIEAISLTLGHGIGQLEITQYLSMNLHGRILNRIKSYQKLLLNYISIKIFLPNIQAKTIVCRYFLQESELELHVTIHTFHYSKNKRNNTNISHVNSIPLKDVGFLGIMSNNY